MSIISWNCRGVAAPVTVSELLHLCKQIKPAIVFLMETRAKDSSERIDRALVNWKWRHKFPNASLIAMPAVSSDHTPIVLRLQPKYKADKSFKFEAFWNDHKECEEIIKMSWKKKEHSNNEWGRLLKKMRNCKENLRNWSRKTFARADIEINKLKAELQKLQEANLNEEQQARREKEIEEAVFSMSSLKAPGPDGLNGLFYQSHWNTIKKEVCAVVKSFFKEGIMPEERWVSLIMKCVRSATYKIRINERLTSKIIPERGLRQGDPISPYLFIMAAEVFTILMEEARERKEISGFKIAPTAPPITHLLFADDCIIFTEAREEKIYNLILILNKYTEASGQMINLDKSGIIFGSQVPIQTRVNIEEIIGMKCWDNLGMYLGLPGIWGRSKIKALNWIEEKVMEKVEGWKEKLLNQARKEVLIKAVIQAIPSYAMSVIEFPKVFCQRLNARIARFWWANSGKEIGIHWKSWDKVCVSKRNGGLGFKDFQGQNLALLAKQAWRIIENPNSIWVRILKAVYFPEGEFWNAKCYNNTS
nr:uncharacterized protein LOC112779177 [Arachis hypogaea]